MGRFPVALPRKLRKGIVNPLRFADFAFMEVLSLCPTQYGRANRSRRGFEGPSLIWSMLEWQKGLVVDREKTDAEKTDGRVPIGEWYAES